MRKNLRAQKITTIASDPAACSAAIVGFVRNAHGPRSRSAEEDWIATATKVASQ